MQGTCAAFSLEHYGFDRHSCSKFPIMVTTKPLETAFVVVHTFFTIIPIVFSVLASSIATQKILFSNDVLKYFVDFIIIIVPIILNVTVWNRYVEVISVVLLVLSMLWIYKSEITPFANKQNVISLTHQPASLTILRSTVNIITAVCILAIDFSSFPQSFRKSRTYGVGLMDTGIGLFIFTMGIVSRPSRVRKDFIKLSKIVAPCLILGLARTIVIQAINYHQDETEYGKHMNAFFTLGLTKLFGGLISAIAGSELQLFIIGTFILTTHECLLLFGVADFVLNDKIKRNTLFLANREGLCSLPGFVAIYFLAMYVGRFMFSETTLTVEAYSKKVKRLGVITVCTWIIMFICIPTIRISRRISNFGYVAWIFSIAVTMLLLYIILTDYVFYAWSRSEAFKSPSLMEATNRNGLVFFLTANILTGCVNMFLNPGKRDTAMSIVILSCYMFLSCSLVYLLQRLRIKIA